jgi:hypothetical protein
MATTIDQSFVRFKQNLEISGLQGQTVSIRQTNVRQAVESGLTVLDSFLTGSYQRSTMIGPLKEADIDVFIVLNPSYFHQYDGGKNNGQAGLLDLVKRVLLKTYTSTPDISRNGQAVTIRFTDFVVDVVPGFNRKDGGYLIPNALTRTWISTDPKKHVELVTAANAAHNNDFVPLVKMIKAWNKTIGKPFRSFHLEVLALEILNRVAISDFPSGVRFYFDKGRARIAEQNPDPAGYGGDVGGYINSQEAVREAAARFQLAYDRAIKAEDYARRGLVREAVEMWRKIFGDYFPVYG